MGEFITKVIKVFLSYIAATGTLLLAIIGMVITDVLTTMKIIISFGRAKQLGVPASPDAQSPIDSSRGYSGKGGEGLVSIIVVNWNGRNLLKECLDSIIAQTFHNWQLIVVDNKSSDNSVDFIRRQYPVAEILSNLINMGFSGGVNEGLKRCKGELIAILNNDVVLDKDWLRHHCEVFNKNPELGFTASKIMNYKRRNIFHSAGDFIRIDCFPGNMAAGEEDNGQNSQQVEIFGACAAAAMYRRTAFQTVGLFDNDFFLNYEDVDWCMRAQLMGVKGVYVPDAVAYHHGSISIVPYSHLHTFYTIRNSLNLIVKNIPLILLIKHIWPMYKIRLSKSREFVIYGSFKAFMRSFMGFCIGLPKMLMKRQRIMLTRKLSYEYFDMLLSQDTKPVNFLSLLKP